MNDPNGLIYHKGNYHLYYQHNPYSSNFGNICWGHATSKDLKQWQHHPIALSCYDDVMIFSGCTIFDEMNVLGHSNGPTLVSIYTEHLGNEDEYFEQICLAISDDGGYSFDQDNRQVILKTEYKDFRDPKIFYYQEGGYYVMVIALPLAYTVAIYRSDNLTDWSWMSDFRFGHPEVKHWECPDLFPIQDEDGHIKWIMSMSGVNYDQESWGMFYFVGAFDGAQFTSSGMPHWMDYGTDFYAGITFSGLLEQTIMMAWCNNWKYANEPSDNDWNGIMSSPRMLTFVNDRLRHSLITDIQPTLLSYEEGERGISISQGIVTVSNGNKLEVRSSRTNTIRMVELPFTIQSLALYEDHGIIEIIINQGHSATFRL